MDPITKIIGAAIALVYAVFNFLPRLLFTTVRLRKHHAAHLHRLMMQGRHITLNAEICNSDEETPRTFTGVAWVGFLVHLTLSERMLRAGRDGVDWIADAKIFRFNRNALEAIFMVTNKVEEPLSRIYLMQPWESEEIGVLNHDEVLASPLYLEQEAKKRITDVADDIFCGDVEKKAGIILHGAPGNGKAWVVRYLACKYRVPVFLALFNPDMDNFAIIRMFSKIKGPAVVVFEDFDSYFDKQEGTHVSFTFDTLLNVMDGVFAAPKRILFALTANEINKVSDKLKKRPSRFREVIEIGNPSMDVRMAVLDGDSDLAEQTAGSSLDEILHLREAKSRLLEKAPAPLPMVSTKDEATGPKIAVTG